MSRESTTDVKRPYRKRRRAELEDETRLRITEAAVDLHGSVGPAKTTISAVAERAGVQRATVYRHFPDEEALFAACSTHWRILNPPPDPESWIEIADPTERLRTALAELYAWYEKPEVEPMLVNTGRDATLVPAMQKAREAFLGWYAAAVEILMKGRTQRGRRRQRTSAAIAHALGFPAWHSLARQHGLTNDEIVELMGALVAAAGE